MRNILLLRSGRSNEPEGRDQVPESNEVENVFDDVERRCECRPVCINQAATARKCVTEHAQRRFALTLIAVQLSEENHLRHQAGVCYVGWSVQP